MPPEQTSLVLVIAAELRTRQSLKELVDAHVFTLEFADSGENGLYKANELIPDAIVLDSVLPDIISSQVCVQLRRNPLLTSVPIILLLDRDDRSGEAEGLIAGADDFLEKPIDGLALHARLKSATKLHLYSRLMGNLNLFVWMVKHAQEGYLLLDSDLFIGYANERAINMLNLPEEPDGLNFIRAVEEQYIVRPPEAWRTWREEDPSPCFLVRPKNPEANALWLVMESLDETVGVEQHRVVRLRDVTEKMSIYQDIRKFHTAVTHKLRTPVSTLASSIYLIQHKFAYLSQDEIHELMQSTFKNTERLVSEVRDVLTYIDAPLSLDVGQPLVLENIPAIVSEVCQRLHLEYVSLSLPDAYYSQSIELTPVALEMVLEELLENSKKFHPQHAPRVDISFGQVENGFIHMRVADDGANMTTEQLSWAWLPYFQGEKDFTGELPGMGLGFPLVATLIWQSGGDLRLSNRPTGTGIVVDMKIPIVQ